MYNVKILDCTLRDGGYINNWEFGNKNIQITIENLAKSNVDIIECGFIDEITGKKVDSTRFKTFESANEILVNMPLNNSLVVTMIEYGKYDVKKLPNVNNNVYIKGIRYSFRKSDFNNSIEDMKLIMQKGYKLFIQPISTNSYTEDEVIQLLTIVNELSPYAVYIVDTQGSMFKDDFQKLYKYFDKYLYNPIAIGFHSHNNMQLSYAIAIDFIELAQNRDIIIDSSIYGMGRGAGNLNTELLADYINKKINDKYHIEYILELIDSYYYTLYKEKSWGYSLAHFLSVSLECHPNYASFLLNKKHIDIKDIKIILTQISKKDSFEFNQDIIEELYFKYYMKLVHVSNKPTLNNHDEIILIGSGSNVKVKMDELNLSHKIKIAINHIPKDIKIDYVFFNNNKRYNQFSSKLNDIKIIVSSNLDIEANYYIDIQQIAKLNTFKTDSAIIMFINFLKNEGFKKVYLVGIDGYNINHSNYSYIENNKVVDKKALIQLNNYIQKGFNSLENDIEIIFLTDSVFKIQKGTDE